MDRLRLKIITGIFCGFCLMLLFKAEHLSFSHKERGAESDWLRVTQASFLLVQPEEMSKSIELCECRPRGSKAPRAGSRQYAVSSLV